MTLLTMYLASVHNFDTMSRSKKKKNGNFILKQKEI